MFTGNTTEQRTIMGWIEKKLAPGRLTAAEPLTKNALRVTCRTGKVEMLICRQAGCVPSRSCEVIC